MRQRVSGSVHGARERALLLFNFDWDARGFARSAEGKLFFDLPQRRDTCGVAWHGRAVTTA